MLSFSSFQGPPHNPANAATDEIYSKSVHGCKHGCLISRLKLIYIYIYIHYVFCLMWLAWLVVYSFVLHISMCLPLRTSRVPRYLHM